MKFKVDVCRVAYSHGFLVVDIPEDQIPRNKRGRIKQKILTKMVEIKAIDQAGSESFGCDNADYSVESVEPI